MKDKQKDFKHTLSTVAAFLAYAYPTKHHVSVIARADPHILELLGDLRKLLVLHDGALHARGQLHGLASLCLFEEGYFLSSDTIEGSPHFFRGSSHWLSQHERLAAIARYCQFAEEL